MRKSVIILAAFTLCVLSSSAQYKWDLGIKMGAANYLGDIGGNELPARDFIWDMRLNKTRANYGFFGRRKFSKRFFLAANLDYISIWGFDANSLNPARRARNLNFRNRIIELGGRGEYAFIYNNDVGGKGYYDPDFRMFLFAGLAAYSHNPQAQIYEGVDNSGNIIPIDYGASEWTDLRPLRTENQESEYSRFGISIPSGVGMNFTFNKKWRIGWELGWRFTFTDYLDDVSTFYGDIDQIAERGGEAFASQTNQNIIDFINNDPIYSGQGGSVNDHRWLGYSDEEQTQPILTQRGDPTDKDSYLTMAFTGSYVIRGTSTFYKAKYSWLRQRRGARRSRAKF